MTEAQPTAPVRSAAFIFIFITVLLDMLAIGIIIPVLPKLVVDFVGGDAAEGARIYGLFGTVWALMQFVFSPVQGALSDRFGRRPVILISNFGLGLDYIVMALAPSLNWLFVGRVISGITAASISTSYAYVADVTPAEARAARFGLLGAAFGIGFVLGPVGYYLRTKVEETPAFERTVAKREVNRSPLRWSLTEYPKSMLAAFGLSIIGCVVNYVFVIFVPSFAQQQLHIPASATFLSTMIASVVYLVLTPLTGRQRRPFSSIPICLRPITSWVSS